jgi:hypothetical protein
LAETTRASALQRLQPVAIELRAHADWYQAVVELGGRGLRERQLREVQQPQAAREALSAASMTASDRTRSTDPERNFVRVDWSAEKGTITSYSVFVTAPWDHLGRYVMLK